jgi:hypothetical protein
MAINIDTDFLIKHKLNAHDYTIAYLLLHNTKTLIDYINSFPLKNEVIERLVEAKIIVNKNMPGEFKLD